MKIEDLHKQAENIGVAIIKEEFENDYAAYLINFQAQKLENVLISSKGYNHSENKEQKTSTLRHFFETVPEKSFVRIEPILSELFGMCNEYWVSYYSGKEVFDKKFIFLPETIQPDNFINIPLIQKKGVLIR
jgi:hypothetical protein